MASVESAGANSGGTVRPGVRRLRLRRRRVRPTGVGLGGTESTGCRSVHGCRRRRLRRRPGSTSTAASSVASLLRAGNVTKRLRSWLRLAARRLTLASLSHRSKRAKISVFRACAGFLLCPALPWKQYCNLQSWDWSAQTERSLTGCDVTATGSGHQPRECATSAPYTLECGGLAVPSLFDGYIVGCTQRQNDDVW